MKRIFVIINLFIINFSQQCYCCIVFCSKKRIIYGNWYKKNTSNVFAIFYYFDKITCCKMLRILLMIITSAVLFIEQSNVASAFFAQEYKKYMSYGAYKKNRTADIYLGFTTGFFFHTWAQNFATYLSPNSDILSSYSQKMSSQLFTNMSGKGVFSFGFQIGLHVQDSKFRHEIGFYWYTMASNSIAVGNEHMTIGGTDYSYAPIDGTKVATAGIYADIYKLMYNVYYDFEHAFKLLKVNWDVFIGGGIGPAFINGGMYADGIIKGSGDSASIDYRDPSSMRAKNYKLNRIKSIAAGYQVSIGAIANISQSFAATIGLVFGATTRPLMTTNFKYINKVDGMGSHAEYHIALQIGILLKAYDMLID